MKTQNPIFCNSPHFQNFWTTGNGSELREWSQAELSLKNFGDAVPYYFQVDETGDEFVKEVFFGTSFQEAYQKTEHWIRNGISESNQVPESARQLFLQTQTIPEWVDWKLVETGAKLCRKAGLNSLMILRDYSLMGGYDFAYLNKPLIYTGALKKGAVKRLADTLDFWVNVTRENALRPHRKGYEMCIKTRIIHSYSRLMILEKRNDWDTEKWGLPINMWDMSATYLGFSLVFLHGLKKLDIEISPEEEHAHFHLWKYIGYLIGIPLELMPENKKQATEMFYLWTSIQPPSDRDSVLLAQSLLDENLESTVLKYQFQRKNLRYLHICMNWYLLDNEVNERLQIPKVRLKKLFPAVIKFQNRIFQQLNSYDKQVKTGGKAQEKVLEDYLKTTDRKHRF